MTLSARIVLRPSRRLTVCELSLSLGGIGVAAAASIARWPDFAAACVTLAIAGALSVVARTLMHPRGACAVTLSERPGVGLVLFGRIEDETIPDAGWNVDESTMVWPRFAVLSLRSGLGARRVMPLCDIDLDPADRRALHRFLRWSLQGGAGRPKASG